MHTDGNLVSFGEWERTRWEQCAAPYAASLGDLTRGSIQAVLDAARVTNGTRVLDVGTGPGFVARAAVERGARVRAVDQSEAMVEIARAAGVDAAQSTADALPYGDATFDAVLAGYLLNHVPSPDSAVTEWRRVLAPGGCLAFTIWEPHDVNPSTGLFAPVVAELGLSAVVPPGPDAYELADEARARFLLRDWRSVTVERLRWMITVEPGAWFDAIAEATPRTGAVLAQAGPHLRAQAREKYIALATAKYATADGLVGLPAAAVLVSARRPPND